MADWLLTSQQFRLIKIGARVVCHHAIVEEQKAEPEAKHVA
jgi:hypothetical protein